MNVYMTAARRKQLQEYAKEKNLSMSIVIDKALEHYIMRKPVVGHLDLLYPDAENKYLEFTIKKGNEKWDKYEE